MAVVTPLVVKPSDHVTFHGLVPVSVAVTVAGWFEQIVALPLTVAVGLALTVTIALPEDVPLQVASETAVTV